MEEAKNIVIDLWGPIRDKRYLESLLDYSVRHNIKMNYRGTFLQQEKQKVYQAYHAFLFPALTENYGHVIADSLALSLPVIISNNTPWNSNKKFKDCGLIAIDNNNLDAYRKVIKYIHSLNTDQFALLRRNTFGTYQKFINKCSKREIIKKIFENK